MKFITRALPILVLFPSFAFAAAANLTYFGTLITDISGIIDTLIPIVFALALLMFLWGMFSYFVLGAGDEGKRETGRSYMVYGLIGLAVMAAVWGIVALLISILGVNAATTITTPAIPR